MATNCCVGYIQCSHNVERILIEIHRTGILKYSDADTPSTLLDAYARTHMTITALHLNEGKLNDYFYS